jgi:beta-lysine 5,6-aminomutase beta subunit
MHKSEPKHLRAYGDREGDGMVQMSFTLAVPKGAKAKETARRFAELHGLKDPLISTMEECAEGFSYFVVYGHSQHSIDINAIDVPDVELPRLEMKEIDHRVHTRLGRKIVVVGACTGSDAHTVGIDAILNMKGYAGEKGLEAYKSFEAYNLGAQVENDQLIERAQALNADAILVSQVITQRNCHKDNGRALIDLLKQRGLRDKFICLFGGPRVDHKLALELGFDAGFGPGTRPGDVASYLVHRLCGEGEPTAA